MEIPLSLLKIAPFPAGLVAVLREIAGDESSEAAVEAVLTADKTWSAEVGSVRSKLLGVPSAKLQSESAKYDIREIAVAVTMHQYLRGALISKELTRYWRYLLACGLICRELSVALNGQPARAFACGLLHDLGRLTLMAAYPTKYESIFAAAQSAFGRNEIFNVAAQERLLFGFDRFQTGEWLVQEWNLPAFFRQIAGKFQSPNAPTPGDIVTVTRVGCSLTYSLGYGLLLGAPKTPVADLLKRLPFPRGHNLGSGFSLVRERTDFVLNRWMKELG